MTYLIITCTEIEADSPEIAADLARDCFIADGGLQWVQPKTAINEAAIESVLINAECY